MKSVQRTNFGVLDKIVIASERAVRRGGQAILEKYRFHKSAFFVSCSIGDLRNR